MGVERRHSADIVSTPSPTLPLPGGGSQNIGCADYRGLAQFHNPNLFVFHEHEKSAVYSNYLGATSHAIDRQNTTLTVKVHPNCCR